MQGWVSTPGLARCRATHAAECTRAHAQRPLVHARHGVHADTPHRRVRSREEGNCRAPGVDKCALDAVDEGPPRARVRAVVGQLDGEALPQPGPASDPRWAATRRLMGPAAARIRAASERSPLLRCRFAALSGSITTRCACRAPPRRAARRYARSAVSRRAHALLACRALTACCISTRRSAACSQMRRKARRGQRWQSERLLAAGQVRAREQVH